MHTIPYGRQDVDEADIAAVVSVLRSDFLTQGSVVPAFEKAVARYCAAKYAVAVNSATSALHLACLALGVGSGDLVWTSPISFAASSNCALYCGAEVDFVDIDPFTYNLSVDRLEEKLVKAAKCGNLPKVVIPVHLCGQSCEMSGIHALAQQYGFKIIEDASHAIGGRYAGEPIGNCQYSDITVFSFHPVKIITTGEGGMALTNDSYLARQIARLRSHGITRVIDEMTDPSEALGYYEQLDLGFNYRMTEVQAALGLSQLNRADAFIKRRHAIASQYNQLLSNTPLVLPYQHVDAFSAWHLYVVRLATGSIDIDRNKIFSELRDKGIGVSLHYIPIYRHPFYRTFGFASANFPEAERYYAEAITLPLYPSLTTDEQSFVVDNLLKLVIRES
jgi:UDP-4-amino-4,6-dideoxy-N-acetyl-beta-L-altrosamine transaminase